MTPWTTDVLVIGAGVIGSAVTYYTAKAGLQVTLVDRQDVAACTSSACDGYVIQQSKSPGIHLQVARESVRLYKTLAQELDYDIEYRPEGCMMLYETEAERELQLHVVEQQRALGLPVRVLDRQETLSIQPCLSSHILGSTWCEEDGIVNPYRLALGFAAAAKRHGARVIPGCPVTAIRQEPGGSFRVTTGQGEIAAGTVVNAAGAWGAQIAAMVGLTIPIKPRRGQLVVTEPTRKLVRGGILHSGYLGVKYNPSKASALGLTFGVEQTDRGNLVVNNTREFVGFDSRTTREGITAVLENAIRFLPALKELKVIRTFAGLRPYTPDGLPVLGPVDGIPGFIMAAGHEGDGIALSPVTGAMVAQFLSTGTLPPLMAHFSLNRFPPPADNSQVS